MPAFQYDNGAGQTAHIVVPDELAAFHRADPKYVEVVDVDGEYLPRADVDAQAALEAERAELEQHVGELAGDELDAAAKAAHVPVSLKADEKRAAIVEQQLGTGEVAEVADYDNPKEKRA